MFPPDFPLIRVPRRLRFTCLIVSFLSCFIKFYSIKVRSTGTGTARLYRCRGGKGSLRVVFCLVVALYSVVRSLSISLSLARTLLYGDLRYAVTGCQLVFSFP